MKIQAVPRKFFLDIKGSNEEEKIFNDWNVISICTPEHRPTRFEWEDIPFSEKYKDLALILYFHDLNFKSDENDVLFTEDIAEQIWIFVQNTKENGKGYLIHCTAGRSRSQAVSMVLNYWLNKYNNANIQDYEENERNSSNRRIPNSLVKRILFETFEDHMLNY